MSTSNQSRIVASISVVGAGSVGRAAAAAFRAAGYEVHGPTVETFLDLVDARARLADFDAAATPA